MNRTISPAGLELVKSFEGLQLRAYKDIVGVLTVGYGHTGKDVHESMTITEAQAEALLRADMAGACADVQNLPMSALLNDNQFSALASLVFNVGAGCLRKTHLRAALDAHDWKKAADCFLEWDHAGGKQVAGLTRRRKSERALFLKETTVTTLLKDGLCPDASDALRAAGLTADRIGQTVGGASASGGTHLSDGKINGKDYTAAVDIRIGGVSEADVKILLGKLADHGFAAFYRNPGHDHWPATELRHVHAIYAGVHMKKALRNQVHAWCNGRNGLKSNAPYLFWQPTQAQENVVRTLFLAHNPAVG